MNEVLRTQWINACVRVIFRNALSRATSLAKYEVAWPYETTPRLVDLCRSHKADVMEEAERFSVVGAGKPGLTEQEREIILDAADFAVKLFKRERMI